MPIDVYDQPLYALMKEIQIQKPEIFRTGKYFSLLGGLYVEHCLFSLNGDLVKGNGMCEIFGNNNLLIIDTGAEVHVNYIKHARYCLQVAASIAYAKLKEASPKSGSIHTPI